MAHSAAGAVQQVQAQRGMVRRDLAGPCARWRRCSGRARAAPRSRGGPADWAASASRQRPRAPPRRARAPPRRRAARDRARAGGSQPRSRGHQLAAALVVLVALVGQHADAAAVAQEATPSIRRRAPRARTSSWPSPQAACFSVCPPIVDQKPGTRSHAASRPRPPRGRPPRPGRARRPSARPQPPAGDGWWRGHVAGGEDPVGDWCDPPVAGDAAVVELEPGGSGQLRRGVDAEGRRHHVGGHPLAALEHHAGRRLSNRARRSRGGHALLHSQAARRPPTSWPRRRSWGRPRR